MIIKQFFIPGIAHYSYLIGDNRSCVIVDPTRDCEWYLSIADELELQIIGIVQTHLHADFISGFMDLHEMTGAPIYAPKKASCAFDHVPVHEGDVIPVGSLSLFVYETPGHTPEHVSYVLTDPARGKEPVAVFCGDTLFVGDVGRPDLFPGRAEELASLLYDSLHKKLLMLPDYCEVYPAHGAGSLCGRALSRKGSTTIGYERRYNQALQITNKDEFVTFLTTNMPPAPDHFKRCSAINRKGPARIHSLQPVLPMTVDEIDTQIQKGAIVLDCRRYDAFCGSHIPGSYNIDFEMNFATFAGWIIPPDTGILLVSHDADQAHKAVTWLYRVGLDNVAGYLSLGIQEWALHGRVISHIRVCSPHEIPLLRDISDQNVRILDIRDPAEFRHGHVPGAENIRFPDIRDHYDAFDAGDIIIVICGTGIRSGIIASLLAMHGFFHVINVAGGFIGYLAAGLPVLRGDESL